MTKYFKLNLDYKNYNFDKLSKDYNSETKNKGKGEVEWGVNCKKISANDVAYIYCFNMPDLRNRFVI